MSYLVTIPVQGEVYSSDRIKVNPVNVVLVEPIEKRVLDRDKKLPPEIKSRVHVVGNRYWNSTLTAAEIEVLFEQWDEERT